MVLEQQKLPWYEIFAGFDFFYLFARSTKTRSPKNWLLANYFLKKVTSVIVYSLCVLFTCLFILQCHFEVIVVSLQSPI